MDEPPTTSANAAATTRAIGHQRRCALASSRRSPGVAGDTAIPEVLTERYHGIAIGLIGGLFDIIADWVLDVPAAGPSPDAVDELITRLSDFYGAVRNGS